MWTEGLASRPFPAITDGTLILDGYGLRVGVQRGHLVASDGLGRERRWGRFSRATARFRRLVVLGHTGTITLDALRWLHDIGSAFTQFDADGQVIVASGPVGLDDARLRRAQAFAVLNGIGMAIARDLVQQKLRGQLVALERLPASDPATGMIRGVIEKLEHAENSDRIRQIESVAAVAYWGAWEKTPIMFARRDGGRIPDHWRTFGTRTSPLTGSPRTAANPANALLNYLYAILEAEARIAALAIGLDPGMGLYHADQKNRDSLACDLMEPVRPVVDSFVLDLLREHTFSVRDFVETRQGVCRVLPPLTHLLAVTAAKWAKVVAPVAERVAQALLDGNARRVGRKTQALPTLLTQASRSAGRDGIRRRQSRLNHGRALSLPQACRICGSLLGRPERLYCDDCLSDRRREYVPRWAQSGQAALAQLRAAEADPAHGGSAARTRGKKLLSSMKEAARWRDEHGDEHDPERFRREILPRLQGITLRTIARKTGLSVDYCSKIRRGLRVPHPRHWKTLQDISVRSRNLDEGGANHV